MDVGAAWRRGPLRVTLSGRNIFGEEYYFVANSESADPGPPRQILLRTTSFALGPYSRVAAALFPNRVRQPDVQRGIRSASSTRHPRTPLENT